MPLITIDAERARLVIHSANRIIVQRGKVVELFCLLLTEDRWISVDDLATLPSWQTMTRASIGKQVARLIDSQSKQGCDLIDWRHKTSGWRLRPEVRASLDPQAERAARTLLEDRKRGTFERFASVPHGEMGRWALNAANAALAMTAGHSDQGYDILKVAYSQTDHPDLLDIANVIATRIGQRLERPHRPVPGSADTIASVFSVSVEARCLAAYAIRSDSSSWEAQLKGLKHLLTRLTSVVGFTTQAYVLNAIAMLLRRLGRHHEALQYARETIPLAIISGDFTLMQSAFFTFGNVVSEVRRIDPAAVADVDPLALLEVDLAIRNQFALGKDSAQAELLLAYLAWENGDHGRANTYLGAAADIIAVNRVPADRALFHRISGLLQISLTDGRACPEGLAELDLAISLFDSIGNNASADFVRRERAEYAHKLSAKTSLVTQA